MDSSYSDSDSLGGAPDRLTVTCGAVFTSSCLLLCSTIVDSETDSMTGGAGGGTGGGKTVCLYKAVGKLGPITGSLLALSLCAEKEVGGDSALSELSS